MSSPPNLRQTDGCHSCMHARWIWRCDNTINCELHETGEIDAAQICDDYEEDDQ